MGEQGHDLNDNIVKSNDNRENISAQEWLLFSNTPY